MKKLLFIIIALLCAVNLSAQSYHFPFKPFKVRVVAQGGNGWVKEGFTDGVVHSFDITIPYEQLSSRILREPWPGSAQIPK